MTLSTDDRLQIAELVSRLCQALDFSAPQAFADVFTPDGVYRAVSSTASGEAERFRHVGATALREFAESAVEKRQGLGRHWTGNMVIEGEGDTASATSYVLFLEIDPLTRERRFPISGVHRDAFVRTTDGWRFTHRTVVADV